MGLAAQGVAETSAVRNAAPVTLPAGCGDKQVVSTVIFASNTAVIGMIGMTENQIKL